MINEIEFTHRRLGIPEAAMTLEQVQGFNARMISDRSISPDRMNGEAFVIRYDLELCDEWRTVMNGISFTQFVNVKQ